jgi:hypothetical protein
MADCALAHVVQLATQGKMDGGNGRPVADHNQITWTAKKTIK